MMQGIKMTETSMATIPGVNLSKGQPSMLKAVFKHLHTIEAAQSIC
jgi:hypothetical protein